METLSNIDALKSAIPVVGLDVLDVGAGQGGFVRALNAAGAHAVGIEVEAEKVERAREASGADIRLGAAQDLPFPDNSFDLLTYIFSFHHIPLTDHAAALAEAGRVLRPGGRIFVAEPQLQGDMTRIVEAIDDETVVRNAALQSLCALPAAFGFSRIAEGGHILARAYSSFDHLLASLVAVDPARRARANEPGVRDRMAESFRARGKQTPTGIVIEQPVTTFIFSQRP